jgi:hypothetical protein
MTTLKSRLLVKSDEIDRGESLVYCLKLMRIYFSSDRKSHNPCFKLQQKPEGM